MQAIFDQIDKGQMIAMASTIIVTELLDQSYDVLMKRMDNKRGHLVEVNEQIAINARTIRSKIVRDKRCLELPDCIYIATAAAYKCDALITVDGMGHNRHALLTAAPEIMRHFGVKVCTPMDMVVQPVLDLQADESERKNDENQAD